MSDSRMCICGHQHSQHINGGECLVDNATGRQHNHGWIDHCKCNRFELQTVLAQLPDQAPQPVCKCGHTQNQHLGLTDYCLIEMSDNSVRHSNWHTKCPCLKFDLLVQHGIHIATLLNTDGEARILFEFEDVHLQIVPDTCAQIALQLLSAVYASRAEQALFKYAQDNLIDPDTLVRFVRS